MATPINDDATGVARLIVDAKVAVDRAARVLPPIDPAADALTDRHLAQVYATEGRRPLVRRAPQVRLGEP